MPFSIALAQIDTTIGDIPGNDAKIRETIGAAAARGADLVVFPELTLTGYPPQDLLENPDFIADQLDALHELADAVPRLGGDIGVVVGFADPNEGGEGNPLFNAAALLAGGRIVSVSHKVLLPNYDVFDEARYFEPGGEVRTVEFRGIRLGISICEDIWNDKDFWDKRRYHTDPIADLAAQGAEILINLSSSPFYRGKPELRLRMLQGISRKYRRPLVYVNLVGGNDSLVFDGMSLVLDGEGKRLAVARSFEEDLLLCDPLGGGCAEATAGGGLLDDIESVRRALVLGLRDYTRKCGFTQVVVGLSGGIDSALTCALAVEALGAQNVLGVLMPSPYSSPGSIEDAEALGRALGIETVTLPIGDLFATFREALSPLFGDLPEDVTEENLQARIRGTLLMAISNKFNRLLLTTGNKSELAVGYCTLYGDMCGGLAMISDVPKTLVYALARRINATRGFPVIPENTLTKPPSAELRPGQKDEDTLPPYEILDPILAAYIEEKRSIEEIVASGLERSLVEEITKRVDRNEYKRRQAPPGLKVTQKAFGMGRRYPIAQRYHPLLKREGKG